MVTSQVMSVLRHLRRWIGARTVEEPTDGQLLEQFAHRYDQQAFAELVRRHGPMVLAVCWRLGRNLDDAEDAFQATFLVLARKAGSIGKPELVGHWLYGVAYRIALKALASAARRRSHQRELTDMYPEPTGVDPDVKDLGSLLDEAVNRLPEKYRVPVVLCYL